MNSRMTAVDQLLSGIQHDIIPTVVAVHLNKFGQVILEGDDGTRAYVDAQGLMEECIRRRDTNRPVPEGEPF